MRRIFFGLLITASIALLPQTTSFVLAQELSSDFPGWERRPVISGTGIYLILENPGADWLSKNFIAGLMASYEVSRTFQNHPPAADINAFRNELTDMLSSLRAVDIFIFSHTNKDYALLEGIPAELKRKIRLVYNAGCFNGNDANKWLAHGIGAYVGHPGTSCSGVFFQYFKHHWFWGETVERAVELSNHSTEYEITRSPVFAFACMVNSEHKTREEAWLATKAQAFGKTDLSIVSVRWRSTNFD